MNLIYDAWIPVRRASGKKEKIAPFEITDKKDPVMELAALRPDFNGALIQFLIGLLQTTCAPDSKAQWRDWLNNPPAPGELKSKFDTVAFAFNLDGDGPRFMQDLTLESELKKADEPKSIDKLLIDSPGGQTEKFNTDHFIKRGRVEQLCFSCSLQALLTLQLNAPKGGAGNRVGLRGGGPINTVILGNNLWETVWNNILDQGRFDNLATSNKNKDSNKFPWCGETQISKRDKQDIITTSQDIHPDQIYWSLPRRIRLILKQDKGQCDLCDEEGIIVREYFTKPYGVMYKGVIHPLTPTYEKTDKGKTEILSVHQHDAVGYKNWLGYVQTSADGKKRVAEIINQAFDRRISNFRLWAFGYDMRDMTASCWYEGVMPVVVIENENNRRIYEAEIAVIIRTTNVVAQWLRLAVKVAIVDDDKLTVSAEKYSWQERNQEFNLPPSQDALIKDTEHRFWQETEVDFYILLSKLREEILAERDGLSVKQAWHECLIKKAERIFDDVSQSEMIDEVNVKRVAQAWNKMKWNIRSKKIRQELGLP